MFIPSETARTLESVIRAAAAALESAEVFYGHGTSNALDEASWLVLSAIGLSPALEPDYQRLLDDDEVARCHELLSRRIEDRMPTAYLTGSAWFAGHRFISDHRALIPRSPLAEFISADFYGVLEGQAAPRVLDLCTGGGCIAIACAYELSESAVDACDLSADALALAAENVELHGMGERVSLYQGNLFDAVDGRYDLVISNPPYVDADDLNAMPAEFAHEPSLGLAAGHDGLDLVRVMLQHAADYLTEHGVLVVEVGNSAPALVKAYPKLPFRWLDFQGGGDGVFLLYRQELL